METYNLDFTEKLSKRLALVQTHLSNANQEARLLAVSKKQSADHIRQAFSLGQTAFGENYLQESIEKIQTLSDLAIEWHFIGPIQSNKCKSIAENFAWVQSIDREKVAVKLNSYCPQGKVLQVCIQVNIDNEITKSGINIDQLEPFCQLIRGLENLKLRGLMAIPKKQKNSNKQRQSFAKLASIFRDLQCIFPELDTLSIGMSQDYQIALDEGATLIRLGSHLFGKHS